MEYRSILIKDTTKEEREEIVRNSMDCGGGCENCSSCWLGGGSPWDIYQDYIDGKREIREITPSIWINTVRAGISCEGCVKRTVPLTHEVGG